MERHKSVKLEKNNTTFVKKNPFVSWLLHWQLVGGLWLFQIKWDGKAQQFWTCSRLDFQSCPEVIHRFGNGVCCWVCCCEEHIMKIWFLEFPSADFFVSITKCRYFCFHWKTLWYHCVIVHDLSHYLRSRPPPRFARYKAQMAEEAKKLCEKYNVNAKGSQAINRWLLELLGFPLTLFLR